MSFNPHSSEPHAAGQADSRAPVLPVQPPPSETKLLLTILVRSIVFIAAAVGALLAIIFPVLHVLRAESAFDRVPIWLGVVLLICVCIYSYFDLRWTFRTRSTSKSNESKATGNG